LYAQAIATLASLIAQAKLSALYVLQASSLIDRLAERLAIHLLIMNGVLANVQYARQVTGSIVKLRNASLAI
jgi:hypothetical protein